MVSVSLKARHSEYIEECWQCLLEIATQPFKYSLPTCVCAYTVISHQHHTCVHISLDNVYIQAPMSTIQYYCRSLFTVEYIACEGCAFGLL